MNDVEIKIEEIDDSWYWQLTDEGLDYQIVLPKNRFG